MLTIITLVMSIGLSVFASEDPFLEEFDARNVSNEVIEEFSQKKILGEESVAYVIKGYKKKGVGMMTFFSENGKIEEYIADTEDGRLVFISSLNSADGNYAQMYVSTSVPNSVFDDVEDYLYFNDGQGNYIIPKLINGVNSYEDIFSSTPLTANISNLKVENIYCLCPGGPWAYLYYVTNKGDYVYLADGASKSDYLMTVEDFRQLAVNYMEEEAKPKDYNGSDMGYAASPSVDSLIDVRRFTVGTAVPGMTNGAEIWIAVASVAVIMILITTVAVVIIRKKKTVNA